MQHALLFSTVLAAAAIGCTTPGAADASSSTGAATSQPSGQPSSQPSSQPTSQPGAAPEGSATAEAPAAEDVVSMDAAYADWAVVLQYTTEDGGFRYEALMADEDASAKLDGFTTWIAGQDRETMDRDTELAFLINAYNAYTIASVVELWPVESVLSEEGFFDARTHDVAGTEMTLNGLENEHIRATFSEPRIHFLVNCASAGCPRLVGTPITSDNLEAQLAAQTQEYVRGTTQVDANAGTVSASQIFEWFAEDFDPPGVRAFIAAQLPEADASVVTNDDTTLSHFEYDWALNARP